MKSGPDAAAAADGVTEDPASRPASHAPRRDDGAGNGHRPFFRQLAELRAHALHLGLAHLDKGKLAARQALIAIVLGLLGFVLAASLIAASAVLILNGLATALGRLFDDRAWIGAVLVGVLTLVLIGVLIASAIGMQKKRAYRKTVEKYEARRARQRQRSTVAAPD